MMTDEEKIRIAKSANILWNPLNDEQRELLVANLGFLSPERNSKLYEEGGTPEHLFYLIRGKVTLQRQGLGGPQIVRMVEPGAIFGYAASFDDSTYQSTAIAGADTEVMTVPLSLVYHFIWENGSFAMLFLHELSSLLGLSINRTINLTQKHIRGRLAEALVTMKGKYGVTEDGQTLAVYLSREDLGQMSNMTTSNAIRTLSAFASEGLVAIEGRKIKIIDESGLRHVSDMG